jgi:hypothetical protein
MMYIRYPLSLRQVDDLLQANANGNPDRRQDGLARKEPRLILTRQTKPQRR